jgi:putative MATE family efflux protein
VATIIAQAGAFITLVLYLNNQNELLRFRPMQMQFDWALFRKSVQIGLPTGFQQTFVALGMLALYKVVNMFGTTVIAAYTVAMRIDSFASLPAMNFSAALSSFVGQNLGGKQFERVKRGLFATLRMTTIFSLSVTVVSLLFSAPIMRMFTADEAVVAIGQDYLHIVSVFYVLFSAMFVLNGMLRGAGDTLVPMFVTLFSLWVVRVPVSFILAKHFGPLGIWWGIPIAWGLGALFSYLYYRTGRWKAKRLVQ